MTRWALFVRTSLAEDIIVTWIAGIMVLVHAGLASTIIVGGIQRFALPSYQPLIDLVGGHVWIWGVLSLVTAISMTFPSRRVASAGLLLGIFWLWTWSCAFLFAVIRYADAVGTAMVAYGGLALVDMVLLTARLADKRTPRPGHD